MTSTSTRLTFASLLLVLFLAPNAFAQGFISPFIGTSFSKPVLEACSVTAGCEDGQRTWGVALGGLGGVFGAEFDLGYTKAFFGETSDDVSSGLLSMMGNLLVGPRIGPVQPYGLVGVGVLRLNVDSLTSTFTENDESTLAWDIGGGVIAMFGQHVGIRGDIRHTRGLQDLEVVAFTIDGSDIKFNRATAALMLKF
jgi:opacity protein-like surface antigen